MGLPDFAARLVLEAAMSPSEDPAKVAQAMQRVVGDVIVEVTPGSRSVNLCTEDPRALVALRDQLRDRRVRSAARRQMLLNAAGRSTSLLLNRQAAAAGVVAICGSPAESPLGPIHLTIESDKLEAVLDWLTAYPG